MLEPTAVDVLSPDAPTRDAQREKSRVPRFPGLQILLAQGLVIVVSVLFALAADRTMRRVDERALERSYLEGLLEDFKGVEAVTEYLRSTAASRDTAAALVLSILRHTNPGNVNGIQLARALELSGWVVGNSFPRGTWDDLTSTGHLLVLRNADLRREIAAFYQRTDQIDTYTRDWVQMTRDYATVVHGILGPEVRLAIGSEFIFRERIPPDVQPSAAELIRRMTSQPALLSTIGDVLIINKTSARMYANLADNARITRTKLQKELLKQ